ncbi:ATP-dependent RNA helicase DbpA [Arcobacter sp.]|uniref:ATP-dependent RNA helicase DbpA n=1 Tax=Arcobacter sp. TaxID=1872629 RepID=UPI003D135A6D
MQLINTLNIDEKLKENLKSLGYETLTKIQEESLPIILEGKDVIAKAKTGSGKTAAFGIGLLNKIDVKKFKVQCLVLCPTRELADQVADELRRIARYKHNIKILTLCGGVPSSRQTHSLSHGAHIIVGTPGRVLFHLREQNLNPDSIDTLVLDEADRMLDMGFLEDIEKVISFIPKQRQTLLFSATYEENIKELSKGILNNPTFKSVDTVHTESSIREEFIKTSRKDSVLLKLFSTYKPNSVIIFCNTKIKCDELDTYLYDMGYDPLVLHSDFEQKTRDEIITLFSNKSYPILIATDVASRGLDIDDVEMVINYDMANDTNVYTHRIGRTARAGKSGVALTLYNDYDEDKVEELQDNKELVYVDEESLIDEVYKLIPQYKTIYISGGKKLKLRPADILGCLIQDNGLDKDDIGKIKILPMCSYVAIKIEAYENKIKELESLKIKGKYFRIFAR